LNAWLLPVLIAPFIGSFLGVVILRLPADGPILWDRSACDHCGHTLGPLDLVPLASFLALRGHCRYCHAAIGWFAPGIELAALALALWAASAVEGPMLLASCVLGWMLLALAAIDFSEEWLPDVLTLPLLILGLAVNALADAGTLVDDIIGAAAGFLVFAAIRFLYRRWRGRDGLGLGDAKLLAAAGAWLSWQGLPSVVLIAAVIGLVMAVPMALRSGRVALDLRLPFGPALCLAFWLVWLYGPLQFAGF
jgi:leader peptidase (prepilin peptidase)/N-methyltransferase